MSNVGDVEKAGMGLLTKVLLGGGGGIGCLGVAVLALMLMMVAGASAANSNDPNAFNTPSRCGCSSSSGPPASTALAAAIASSSLIPCLRADPATIMQRAPMHALQPG